MCEKCVTYGKNSNAQRILLDKREGTSCGCRLSGVIKMDINTLRTGLLNCLNARSWGLTFRYRASCIQGQAFRYYPENAFYVFNQQIYFII